MDGVVLLGSGGWIPTGERATCGALVRRGDHALLIDAGTAIGRLVEHPELLEGATHTDLVLTHFHLDHVVGLAYLPALPTTLRLHGPGEWLYGRSTAGILGELIAPPLFAVGLEQMVEGIEEVVPEGVSPGPFRVSARVQERHNHPTLAFRVDDELTYCTDTSYDEGNVELARGSRLLLHEAWYTEDAPREVETHSSAREAAQVASEAGVERLVLIHIRPGADTGPLLREARSTFQSSVVGEDLKSLG